MDSRRFPCSFTLFTNEERISLTADTEKQKLNWINVIQFNKNQEDSLKSQSEKGKNAEESSQTIRAQFIGNNRNI